jgi:carbon-monoxide dehydrogenase medium subunit
MPVVDFFCGPAQTSLGPGEILTSIFLPPLPPTSRSLYLRLGRKRKADLALVGMALVLSMEADNEVKEIRIGLGGVGPRPFRAKNAEALARGRILESTLIEEIALKASEESQPISDIRGSADYKKAMVVALVSKGLRQLGSKREKL